ncbi:HXXEE domain-containing protein [Actinoplanes hulinensis]|uniref:HXXEE domain-containing protein n=1 Tax=Actinoplanes hulinensis TaxID=1144547 RepID=A0ABS7BC52_9ACTN|nr:HXXEE domain-containing protein [Actinoplanes hulinensis]MBW6438477.1 HXXEE domain-containing protein [Actinoplanes hulinensis]
MSRRTVCLGLFAVWAVHDVEEVLTATWWSGRTTPRLLADGWPSALVESIGSTTPRFALAAAVVGVVVLSAAIRGARTGGRSPFFRAALLVFGWHGAVHIGQAIALRDYVPGLVTAVTLVIPYSIWAWRRLPPALLPGRIIAVVAFAAIAVTAAAQALARLLL